MLNVQLYFIKHDWKHVPKCPMFHLYDTINIVNMLSSIVEYTVI